MAVFVVMLLLTGCEMDSGNSPAAKGAKNKVEAERVRPYNDPPVEVVVTRDDTSLPSGCRPREVAGLVTTFFDAYNEGNRARLPDFFIEEHPEQPGLYGSSEDRGGKGFGTHDQDELLRYFEKRHAHGERLELLQIDVEEEWEPGIAGGTFVITRRADDLEPGLGGPWRVAYGKAVVDCEAQRIVRWQMAMEMAERGNPTFSPYSGPCDEPTGWEPGEAAIACARRD